MAGTDIKIVRWDDCYADDFIGLSEEWLVRYVSIEPADIEILHHPHEMILEPGGMIFFALDGDAAVGCVAMIPDRDGGMELAKLAVTEEYKGRGIGNLLMAEALTYADGRKAEPVYLYTNRKLVPAIGLYEKFGFREIALENNKYLESDMKMVRRN